MRLLHRIKGSSAVEIANSVESEVARGALEPGDALPTIRTLAGGLGVSPATVGSAYRQLKERGVIVTRGRAGSVVSPQTARGSVPLPVPDGVRDLATGNPDPALLPALGPALRGLAPPRRLYGEALLDPDLEALARQQMRDDGVPGDHLTVVSGALDGIERVLLAHLRPGDRVGVEDPCFSGVLSLLAPLGLEPVPIQIDDAGLRQAPLEAALASNLSALIVTPRAQNPTGAALDATRARQLARVLADFPDLLVIEDDHAGPVAGAAVQTLCARRARFAVVRSYAKSLGPDLRVASVSADAETIRAIERRQLVGMRWVSHILQQLVVALLCDAGMATRLRRAAQTYGERRNRLIEALAHRGIEATGRSGLNVWIPVPEEAAVVAGLLERGFAVTAGERFRLKTGPAIRVTTSTLETPEVATLADALADLLGRAPRPDRT